MANRTSSRKGTASRRNSASPSNRSGRRAGTRSKASSRHSSTRYRATTAARRQRSRTTASARRTGSRRTTSRSTGRASEKQSRRSTRLASSQGQRGQTSGSAATVLTDHDEIRRWAEERNAQPACVRRTGGKGDVGMIRLDFPGFSAAQSLEPIGWDEWFQKFDESKLALLVQEKTARGQKSNFNKLIDRETAQAQARGEYRSRRHPEGRRTRGKTESKSTRGSTREARTASVRGEKSGKQQRRAA